MPQRAETALSDGIRIDRSRAQECLLKLLATAGLSGKEEPVAQFLVDQLTRAGVPPQAIRSDAAHRRSALGGTRGNLILKLPGTTREPRRMLSAHMDVVPVCAGAKPVRKGRRIVSADKTTGLGGDNRAGCAVLLAAALELVERKLPHPPLTFLWTVQEEAGLHGARHVSVSALGKPQMAFNFDGGGANTVTIGATSGYRMSVVIDGIPSHAGVHPEKGVSAIAIAALAISDLVENGWHGQIEKRGRRGTSNVGVIQGGGATNVVTDRVLIKAEARSHDAAFRKTIVREIGQAFRNAVKRTTNDQGKRGQVAFDGQVDYEAFLLKRTDPAVIFTTDAVEAEGLTADYRIANGGLDANWLNAHGITTVTLGCGQNNIHTSDEWLDLNEFERACRIALRLTVGPLVPN